MIPSERNRHSPPKGIGNISSHRLFNGSPMSDRRVHPKSIMLAQSTMDSGTGTGTARVRIYTPSARLRLTFGIAFYPTAGTTEQATIPATAVWSAAPCLQEPVSQRYMTLQNLFSSLTLPDAYEMDSASKRIDITATLAHVDGVAGHWMLIAIWEPNTLVSDEELDHLFASCDLQLQGQPLNLNA